MKQISFVVPCYFRIVVLNILLDMLDVNMATPDLYLARVSVWVQKSRAN